ncbi:MAG: tRNA1(Val) (adenine(37)-N6)-methyltransferase [Vallitalea sp.]|jgi:tRNA1(Val) A37 N6-methylase TrmN6|nr:tRNA1(Val) (adenine(37)-N6)-methyltransferase [Vallitalea sp.]
MELRKDERIDDLHRKGYKIIQNPNKFCFGMDAVLLTGFTSVRQDEKVLDLGTGTGIIPILLEAKTKGKSFTGLEIQEGSIDMAKRSVKLNGLDDKIFIVKGDIKEAEKLFPLSSFDVITSNPPYMNNKSGIKNTLEPKSIARHEILCELDDVIKNAASLVKVGGRFYMVHRPNRLPEIIVTLKKYKLEPKRMRFVHPYVYKEPNMVLIESVRHGKPQLKIEPPLMVYKEVGKYTEEIYEIYGYNK